MSPESIELLSPARDAAIGIAAINHGADAVYIGGPEFGARAAAGNTVADIEKLAAHAHGFNARVFVTLNTILRDDELEPARRLAWQLYEAGADALIIQDMGLLELDLPPIQLHASTQTDIRTPAKARFLQDVGFSQMVLARELTLSQIGEIAKLVDGAKLEFFVHGALCVAYSGQCWISHAHTGRSANRGDCSQACRLPYTVTDANGGIVAHERHVLSLKDNNQSANLEALIDAGIRSFKIEGRYKDVGYVKNITAHYRQLLDSLFERRTDLHPASSGRCSFGFVPDPNRNFNRGATDYFVNGRQDDIGAFDSPKHAGMPVGHCAEIAADHLLVDAGEGVVFANGDGLTWFDLQHELQGLYVNRVEHQGGLRWRIFPQQSIAALRDLRRNTPISRNRDVAWDRLLGRESATRSIAIDLELTDRVGSLCLSICDSDGHRIRVENELELSPARDPARADAALRQHLSKLGGTIFEARRVDLKLSQSWFVPVSAINALRREAVDALIVERAARLPRLERAAPVEPPVAYPEDALSYAANVFNHRARDFYAGHGVKLIAAAYESHEELGEVSLMITKHCVRWSLSLCPKQAKGVIGVQGTVRAEPLQIVNGDERLTLRFECKPCEMHVVGRIKRGVVDQARSQPVRFYRTRDSRGTKERSSA